MGLNNYFGLVASDSDYSFSFGGEDEDAATISTTDSHNNLTKCNSQSMLNAYGKSPKRADKSRAVVPSCDNQLVRQFSSFVF